MAKSYKFDDMKQLIQLNDKTTCMDVGVVSDF